MTRQEFIDNVDRWWQLVDFCNDYDLYSCEDIYDYDQMNDYVDEKLYDLAREESWTAVRDILAEIDTNYDYYRIGGIDDIEGMTEGSDFDDYKDAVLEEADANETWDEEEEEVDEDEEYRPSVPEEEVEDIEPEPIDFSEFLVAEPIEVITTQPEEDAVQALDALYA